MNETELTAIERVGNPKALRKSGYIPGVLYGGGYEKGVPVKFEEAALNKVIKAHGPNAKVWIAFNGNRQFGFIQELQKDVLSGKITHSDIHVLSQNDDIRIKLPILFNGVIDLEHKNLILQIHNSKVDISGKAGSLPEHITVNVENMKLGDAVKVKDLKLPENTKAHDPVNEIYAVVIEMKALGADTKTDSPPENK